MRSLNNQSRVLLPKWLTDKRNSLKEEEFINQVNEYLQRYPDYLLIEVVDNKALCERIVNFKEL